ncbi:MAG TPA: ABATE domain-containing protein [Solirubrobacteraceae bacterium]|nr:ABATE domain-containing protein [Solirubrobacteraceae bacterium]
MSEPGQREPAPAPLAGVQAFVNTNDIEAGRDRFQSPADLREWLVDRELLEPGVEVSDDDLRRALAVREAIRALAAAHNRLPADSKAATARLNAQAERAGLAPELDAHEGLRIVPRAGGVDGALGHLLAAIYGATADGSWERLKACGRDSCRWVFYDRSKNRSGSWCDPADCGTRERSRRAYRRRRDSA